MSQFERIAYIDRTIREEGCVRRRQVEERFEVSDRQVKRDIEYLRDRLNVPIVCERASSSYHYGRPFDALRFADEKLLIFHALLASLIGNQNYLPLATSELLATVEGWISHGYREISNRVSYAIPVSESIEDLENFTAVCEAMEAGRRLDVDYENARGERSSRSLEPERLVNYAGRWYLIAYDLLHNELRTFHLARIRRVSISRARSAGGKRRHDAAERYLASGFGIFNGSEIGHAVVRVHGPAAAIVARQHWHRHQRVESGTDPSGEPYTDMSVPVSDWREILGRVLSFGSAAEALAPGEFRRLWREEIGRMAERAGERAAGRERQSSAGV